jgi:hypothetical protein
MEKGGKKIMGKPNRTHILRMVSIIVALTMIVPGVVLTQQFKAATPETQTNAQSEPTTYAWVNIDSPTQANVLKDIGAKIVSLREDGAYVKVTESQKNSLSTQLIVNDLPTRTEVNLFEQGIRFDSQVGYDLPAELRKAGTNEYLVQFVAPTETPWNDGVQAVSGKILRSIGDNLIVVKMTPAQKTQVESLDYVQWVGAYEPGFKIDKNIPATGTVKITVDGYPNADISALMSQLTALGASQVEDSNYGTVICYIDASAIPEVAKLDSAMLVWNLPEMKTMNNVGARISQASDLWVNTVSNLPSRIAGAGQIIHIQDTGIDSTHRDFVNGPLGNRITYTDLATDTDGHGTHVAGTAAGNGYDMEAYLGLTLTDNVYNQLAASNPAGRPDRSGFAGRAPEATIYFRAGLVSTEWAAGYTAGARIFTNSWGPGLMSNAYDGTADTFMNSNAGALVLFAIGNDGPRTNTASGSGNGKLTVGVGAVENMRPVDFDSSDDYNQMASFSGRGPVADGRIKPDVCEVGTAVYSTLSQGATPFPAPLYDALGLINTDPDAALGDYQSLQGTSMACPAAAGDAILIRDYLVDVKAIAAPHANLMKTLLIHGAQDIGLGYPSMDQGWGRINVRNSICPPFPNVIQWYHHATGIASGSWSARIDGALQTWVIDNTVPLKVTMVHWDAVGSGTLTTDYDLVVTSPSGVRYEGNAFNEGWSTPCTGSTQWGGTFTEFPSWVGHNTYDYDTDVAVGGDDMNNVEVFRIKYPEKGQWNVQVFWRHGATQPFTVAMTGGFNASADTNAANNAYRVNVGLDVTRIVPERDDFGEAIFKCAPSGSVIIPYWINNGGTTNDVYSMSAPLLPTGITIAYTPASPVTVNTNTRTHGYARIMVGAAVTAGTYTVSLRATSTLDLAAPIAQSDIKFQIDVVTTETPPTIEVAATPAHESGPTFCSWGTGGINIGCAYTQDTQFGERVYFKQSADGGATWGAPVVVSPASWNPGYVSIAYMPSGTYAGRIMIAWNAWNPDGVGGSTSDTRCAYIKVAFAVSPYTTWTLADAFTLGEGRSVGNSYRTVNVIGHPATNAFMLVVETFGYTGTDLGTATQDDISCASKVSTNGGTTWGAIVWVDTNQVTPSVKYYFFPSVDRAPNGNIFVYFYERDSADAAQDRDATFREYSGTWGTYYVSMDTLDNMMMPCALATNEGTGNRRYGFYLKGANTDGDRYMNMHYSDDGTTWQTNGAAGWQLSTTVMSDHDYGTRFVFDAVTSNGYEFVFGHRKVNYDPYLLVVYGTDLVTARTQDFLTLDSFVHGKQRAVETTHATALKVFIAQNQMTTSGGHDIIGMHVYNGWAAATDIWGPVTEYLSADKTICNAGDTVTVVANVHDWTTGGSLIAAAEYKTDVSNVTGVAMQSFDGSFNSPAEAVQSTTTPISTAGWTPGWHWIFVRGQDAALNWGAWEGIQIYVNAAVTATATATGPLGTSNQVAVTLTYTKTGIPTSINLYYTKNTVSPYTWVLAGNDATPNDGTYAYTITAGAGTYGWLASAVGGGSTEPSPPGTTIAPEATPYILDLTAPVAPSPFTVVRYGVETITNNQTRYMANANVTVNGLTTYSLQLTQSTTASSYLTGSAGTVYTGFRAWKRSSAGVETEITAGTATSIVNRATTSEGLQAATYACPATVMVPTDSLIVRVYQSLATPPTNLAATFTTEALGATSIDAGIWTINYYTRRGGVGSNLDRFYWGTATYNSNIAGIAWTSAVNSTDHNTLSWTHTGTDVAQYVIYRSATQVGGYTMVNSVPVGTNTFTDLHMGAADATYWWYIVRAVDAAGNGANSTAVQEPNVVTNPAYSIPLTGKLANSWVFVSFPSATSGAINTVLNDATAGDGQTTWSVAKWFNAQDKADPWKTYRVGSTVNDMPTLTSSMGVWLWLTANGGDFKLTLNSYVANATTNVLINLYAGWNMVGYPSATARLASVTLPAQADYISVWQAASPYLTDYATLASVTMSAGNAYMVRVTADCTWTVVNP